MVGNIGRIFRAHRYQVRQQPVEQGHVTAWPQRKMQVSRLRRCRPARVDHDDPCAALCLRRLQALEQHRVTPGEIGANQHHQVSLLKILIGARHRVAAEGALVPCHR